MIPKMDCVHMAASSMTCCNPINAYIQRYRCGTTSNNNLRAVLIVLVIPLMHYVKTLARSYTWITTKVYV